MLIYYILLTQMNSTLYFKLGFDILCDLNTKNTPPKFNLKNITIIIH